MDNSNFMNLLEAHRDRVYSYLLYSLRDRDDAEDLTQEVFLRLWRQKGACEPDRAEAWLIRVAHNLCVDLARRRKTVRKHLGRADETALEKLPSAGGSWQSPESSLQQSQARQEILTAMGTLPDETRSVMMMHYFQGLRLQDIARILGKQTSTVKVQIHRARKALRLVLEAGVEPAMETKRETG